MDPTTLTELGDPRNPFISPDGNWVGFFDGPRALQRVSIRGGPPVPISEMDGPGRGASWGADDTIIFATGDDNSGLWQVALGGGGEPELLTTPDPEQGERDHLWPEILPGGRAVLFTIEPQGSNENAQIAVLSLESRTYEVLLPAGSHARYVPTGHLVYGVRDTLQAVGFDLDRLEVTSDPVPVVDTVNMKASGAANFSVSENGSLVYVRGGPKGGLASLVWVDRQGIEEPFPLEPGAYAHPRFSPTGDRMAMERGANIWIYDVGRELFTQLTFDATSDSQPVWTVDGQRIVFASNGENSPGLFWVAADGSAGVERLTEGGTEQEPYSWSADGATLVLNEGPRSDWHQRPVYGRRSPGRASPAGVVPGRIPKRLSGWSLDRLYRQ